MDASGLSDEVRDEIDKRLTLNLLIQGAAAHSFLTAHYLVRDELEALRPGLTRLYDKFAISGHLYYFFGEVVLVSGFASRFWRRTHRPQHPFFHHPLLATHGYELYRASKKYLLARGREKGVIGIPILHYLQMLYLGFRVARAERGRKPRLAELARRSTSLMWGIGEERLDAQLTVNVGFGNVRPPQTYVGKMMVMGAIGWGGVQRHGGRFTVVAKSWFWPLVVHELTKGVAELVCLHGLNTLDDETYERVMREADQIEYETWMLQTGAEMWRRLLAVLPHDRPLSEMLMHIARLAPARLERLMFAVVDDPATARRLLADLGN